MFPSDHIKFEKKTLEKNSGSKRKFLKNIEAGKIYSILIKKSLV